MLDYMDKVVNIRSNSIQSKQWSYIAHIAINGLLRSFNFYSDQIKKTKVGFIICFVIIFNDLGVKFYK